MVMNNTKQEVDQQDQHLLDTFSAFVERESWTREQVLTHQQHALQACREYACAHSPFYLRFHHGLMDRPLQELPVLTKAMLREHFDDIVTDRAIRYEDIQHYLAHDDPTKPFLDRYQILATSGST